MAIEIKDSPEPLSEESLRRQGPDSVPLLVESSASRVLMQELKRYCEGIINGRSFLIAGHRGAGKTTLVAKAFLDVRREADEKKKLLRPLFIPLHGPSLFPDPVAAPLPPTVPESKEKPKPRKREGQNSSEQWDLGLSGGGLDEEPEEEEEGSSGKPKPKPQAKSGAQIALEQITLGLHRAVSREFAERYRARATALAELRRKPNQSLAGLRQTRIDRDASKESSQQAETPQPANTPQQATPPGQVETLEQAKVPGQSKTPPKAKTPEQKDLLYNDPLPEEAELQCLLDALPTEPELFELAAQFEAELYESPPPQRLREFWQRLHALSGGVLFPGGFAPLVSGLTGSPTGALPTGIFPNLTEVHGQGARELVALSGVSDAYRRISGDYTRTDSGKDLRQRTDERSVGFDSAKKDLIAPIVSLLTGGLAATGLALSGTGTAGTAIGAIVGALGASLVFKVSTTRKRDRLATREDKFIYDLSVATLDRILPILIERLRSAGLAPVFVVDELDKVDKLSSRIVTMVHHLKKLVAENAFFCFLTNRGYFEEMLAQGSGRPYPVEYTYYTQRLFVVFSPEDFEQYLRKRIPDPPPAPPIEAPEAQSAMPDSAESKESIARAILRWALRHRAQLHVVDLQREIAALRDDEGGVRTDPETLASAPRNLIDVTFQVAIELTLGQREVEQVLLDRPEFRRMLHDAMYYLSRRWLEGAEEVDLSEDGREALLSYLEGRTGREEERQTEVPATGIIKPPAPSVSPKDLDFLLDQVGILADFLSDREQIEFTAGDRRDRRMDRLAAWNEDREKRGVAPVEPDVLDVLLIRKGSSILIQNSKQPGWYRFRHRVAGRARELVLPARPVPPPAPPPPPRTEAAEKGLVPDAAPVAKAAPQPSPPVWQGQAKFIEDFAKTLGTIIRAGPRTAASKESPPAIETPVVTLDSLATRFRIMAPSPTESVAHKAIRNLRDAAGRGAPPAATSDEAFLVDQFHQILLRNGEQIARALVLGAVVGRPSPEGRSEARIAAGLDVIARGMQFANKREEDVKRSLEDVSAMVRKAYGNGFEKPLEDFGQGWPSVEWFGERTKAALEVVEKIPLIDPAALLEPAWESLHTRLTEWVKANVVPPPNLAELLAGAARLGPTQMLEFDPREMTLQQWTRTLLAARTGRARFSGGEARPPSLGLVGVLLPGGPPNLPPQPGLSLTWLTFFAWHALGFRANGYTHVQQFAQWAGVAGNFGVDVSASSDWPVLLQRTHRLVAERSLLLGGEAKATLLMLRRTASAITAPWRPLPGRALLLMTTEELQQIVRSLGQPNMTMRLPGTTDQVCAIEMEPELATELYSHHLPAMRSLLQAESWLVYAYSTDRGREMRQPNVLAPSDPQMVIDAGIRGRTRVPEVPAS